MRLLYRNLILIFYLILPLICWGEAGTAFNKIVFFGDSLSDDGNLYGKDFGYLPKSPPYFQGRFSNGYTWAENVAKYFYDQNYIASTNFAFGGETAIFHNPTNGFLPFSLTASLDSYLLRTAYQDRSHTLFVLWIGSNDYLNGSNQIDRLTTDVVANIKSTIESLISHGGQNFLLINLPDFSVTPYGHKSASKQVLQDLARIHNEKLSKMVQIITEMYKSININLFDLNTFFVDLVEHTDVYNKKYGTHITNSKESCWSGGYTVMDTAEAEDLIYQALQNQKHYGLKTKADVVGIDISDKDVAHYIRITPALREAISVEQQWKNGMLPCKSPDEYIFWDQLHPTAIVHKLLGDYLVNYINHHYSHS